MHTPGRLYPPGAHLDDARTQPRRSPGRVRPQACPHCGAPMVFETRDEKVAVGAFAADVPIETWWCDRCGEAIFEGAHVSALDAEIARLKRLARSPAAVGIATAWASITPTTDAGWNAMLERTAPGWRWVLTMERWVAFPPANDPGLRALLGGKPIAVASLELRRNAHRAARLRRERPILIKHDGGDRYSYSRGLFAGLPGIMMATLMAAYKLGRGAPASSRRSA